MHPGSSVIILPHVRQQSRDLEDSIQGSQSTGIAYKNKATVMHERKVLSILKRQE